MYLGCPLLVLNWQLWWLSDWWVLATLLACPSSPIVSCFGHWLHRGSRVTIQEDVPKDSRRQDPCQTVTKLLGGRGVIGMEIMMLIAEALIKFMVYRRFAQLVFFCRPLHMLPWTSFHLPLEDF